MNLEKSDGFNFRNRKENSNFQSSGKYLSLDSRFSETFFFFLMFKRENLVENNKINIRSENRWVCARSTEQVNITAHKLSKKHHAVAKKQASDPTYEQSCSWESARVNCKD